VPESAERAAERKRLARRAADRRAAVTMLQIGECTMRYAAVQLGNGISAAEARETALFVAGELTAMAEALRRLTRLGPDERRALAVQLAALGFTQRQIATRLGVSERAVRYYVTGRACL
jgi:DNA-directed RNA polymerase specialized sigma24 family protein